ncbi:MAG: redoxin domain-containing protein [Thermodesulfobacteriota bacterium]
MSKSKKIFLIVCFLSILCQIERGISEETNTNNGWKPKEGLELIGTQAPSLNGLKWLNVEPLDIEDLRGKVVLIRFWLVGCPLCERTAPALVELYDKYKEKGFILIGIHHPKSEKTKDPELVRRAAEGFGFTFPIAQDNNWKVINSYWLDGRERSFTSVSFLIDKKGLIRLIHDGGEFYRSESNQGADSAYQTIEEKIQELLKE